MKPETAFKILVTNRRMAAKNKTYIVRSLTKSGAYSKAAPHPLNCCNDLESAKERLAAMESMNPGQRFAIEIQ